MLYGVSYYPEHKTPEDLEHDLELLIQSGINTVRMGEFAWCRWEPKEGEFHFEWMDPVVERLGKAGIRTIICTPTACPPAWMIEKHPDILYTDNRGVVRPFGGRRHYCYNNPAYREYSRIIAEKLGEHYGANPYVAGFQIDNEPAQEGTGRCHCARCNVKFQNYLKNKYGTIEEFNRRSGGIFWSQEYTGFHQINIPVNTIEAGAMESIKNYYENPTVRLEFERFASDCQIEYQNIQEEALRKYTSYPVTTNATGLATNSIDYYKSTKTLDRYAFDLYPEMRDAEISSFPYAFARGVKDGAPFWVLEFNSGGGHRFGGSGRRQPNPGALKLAVLQSYAQGADMMLHFQFRTFPFGAEQLNYAIVDMDGVPRRRYYEMQETAALLKKLAPYQPAKFANEVAILLDYDVHWALRIKPVNDPEYHYLNFAEKVYRLLEAQGIGADVVSYDADLYKYKTVILPSAIVLPGRYRDKLKDYVARGGHLMATFLTSVKNEDNVGYTETLPAGLTDLFGVTVEEVEPIFSNNRANVKLTLGAEEMTARDRDWCDLLGGEADMIGVYTDSYKAGSGIVSAHTYGQGRAYYMGAGLEDEALRELLGYICDGASVERNPFPPVDRVQVSRRVMEDGSSLYYLLNFSGREVEIPLDRVYTDCVKDAQVDGSISIPAVGFAVLRETV